MGRWVEGLVGCAAIVIAGAHAQAPASALTPTEQDDVREAVFRSRIPKEPSKSGARGSTFCVAFGTASQPTGQDPPPAFMARFEGLEHVKPRSWCVEQRAGTRLAVGPVEAIPPRDSGERAVRTWLLYQTISGGGSYSRPVEAWREPSGWVVSERGVAGRNTAPTVPELDSAEDRRRIAAVGAAFAEAWNRQDFDAMGNTNSPGLYARQAVARNFRARFAAPMTHTRLDAESLVVELSDIQRMSATGRMEMRGTWAPQSGAIVPLDPWKHEGAVTAVKLTFAKHTSAWEPGDWYITRVDPPWARNH